MVLRGAYVLGRSDARGNPVRCQHRLLDKQTKWTACGVDVSRWSRGYQVEPIHEILCRRAQCYGSPTRPRLTRRSRVEETK